MVKGIEAEAAAAALGAGSIEAKPYSVCFRIALVEIHVDQREDEGRERSDGVEDADVLDDFIALRVGRLCRGRCFCVRVAWLGIMQRFLGGG